jgi:hypothetical protein
MLYTGRCQIRLSLSKFYLASLMVGKLRNEGFGEAACRGIVARLARNPVSPDQNIRPKLLRVAAE